MTRFGDWLQIEASEPVTVGVGFSLLTRITTPVLVRVTSSEASLLFAPSTFVAHSDHGRFGSSARTSSWLSKTAPLSSLTKSAQTVRGSISGTAHGSIPDSDSSLRISIFACVFGLGVNGMRPQSDGASSSVAFASRIFVEHGSPGVAIELSRP